jgi:alpha-beta hydrolase superfamily lysophospholipase
MDDVGEAIKIGKQIGETVIIMATSTGGTLAAAAALDKAAMENVGGIIFISPNFAINNRAANLLTFAICAAMGAAGDWHRTTGQSAK